MERHQSEARDLFKKIMFRARAIRGFIIFRKWGVFLGRRPRICGLGCISIGPRFGAGDHFWLAAITSYQGEVLNPRLWIGANVSFSDFCHVAAINSITIGDNVLVGSRVLITDHSHGHYSSFSTTDPPEIAPILRKLYSSGPVNIGSNVWIGDGAVILPNVTIGDGAIIGANSVVTRDVPRNTIVAGAPARAMKEYVDGKWRRT